MSTRALIIVDVQKAFDDPSWGERNNPQAEETIKQLLNWWREKQWEVIHIQHVSDNPDSLFYLKSETVSHKYLLNPKENERIFTKKVNSSFIGTDLEKYLREKEIETVVITGLTTPHCVSTTTRMSGNLGFETYLISDGTAAFGLTDQNGNYHNAQTIHDLSLATLHNEFATVLSAQELIKKWSEKI